MKEVTTPNDTCPFTQSIAELSADLRREICEAQRIHLRNFARKEGDQFSIYNKTNHRGTERLSNEV